MAAEPLTVGGLMLLLRSLDDNAPAVVQVGDDQHDLEGLWLDDNGRVVISAGEQPRVALFDRTEPFVFYDGSLKNRRWRAMRRGGSVVSAERYHTEHDARASVGLEGGSEDPHYEPPTKGAQQ